jgi:hypothetical protein
LWLFRGIADTMAFTAFIDRFMFTPLQVAHQTCLGLRGRPPTL